ncbi:MAG: CDP-glycerol glycerophosphotransferase family protein [Clostridia bacterium]|nr:CDP-glycerol glycerophosphotransferase family protein [Clostridia bacterium]
MKLPRLFAGSLEYRAIVLAARAMKGIDRNKVVFMSFRGRGYSDNPRAISERLHERRPETEIVWLFKGNAFFEQKAKVPDYVRCVNRDSRKSWIELATARVWVDNFTKDVELRGFPKDKQFYVQTWHGDRPIKKIAYDATDELPYRLEEECSRVVTGSDFGMRMYRTAFRYKGEYINEGAPRNDILVKNDPADVRRVRAKLGVPEGVKLLLYAPTYREDTAVIQKDSQMNLARILDCLERGGEKWLCLYRAHYLSEGIDIEALQGRLVDMTAYDDMSELLLAADMLLTDYSSCAADYCVMDKPVFMYMADYDHYLSTRDCYYDPHDTPLMIAHDQDELERLITTTDADAARENCRTLREWYGIHETGRATDAVCDYIIDKLK